MVTFKHDPYWEARQSLGFFLALHRVSHPYTWPFFTGPLLAMVFYPICLFLFTIYSPSGVPKCPKYRDRIENYANWPKNKPLVTL